MVIFWEMNAKRVASAPLFNSTLEHFHLTVCIVTSLFVLSPHCLYCQYLDCTKNLQQNNEHRRNHIY